MKPRYKSASALLIGLTLLTGYSTTASAQNAAGRGVRAICCKCIDGQKPTVSVNTGSAPWMLNGAIANAASNPAWTALAPASWVGPATSASNTDYTYTLTIIVPKCTLAARAVSVEGQFAADNRATAYMDGNPIGTSTGYTSAGVANFTATGLLPGPHTLKIVVRNDTGPTSLIVRGQVTTACPSQIEQ